MNRFMTPRLLAMANLVPEGAAVIDVGSDHAYLPIYLVGKSRVIRALATDIHAGPLRRSAVNVKRYGLAGKIALQKADGLCDVDTGGFDTIVIGGMGGELIERILRQSKLPAEVQLILQPMTAVAELRAYLIGNGYRIVQEVLAQEGEKLYTVLLAVQGEDTPYTAMELLLGRKTKDDALYPALLEREKARMQKQLAGLMQAAHPPKERISFLQNMLAELHRRIAEGHTNRH